MQFHFQNSTKDRVTHFNISVAVKRRRDNKMYHLYEKYLCLTDHKNLLTLAAEIDEAFQG